MIYNEDCLDTLNRNLDYDYIITSPPDFDEIGADTKNIQPYIDFLKERIEKFNPKGNVVTIFVSDRKAEGTVIPTDITPGVIVNVPAEIFEKVAPEKSIWVTAVTVVVKLEIDNWPSPVAELR